MRVEILSGLTRIPIDDREHAQILSGPVQTLQSVWEFEKLLDLYRIRRPKRVLELGTAYGGSLYHFLKNSYWGTTIVSVDSYKVSEWYGPKDNRELYEEWCPPGVEVIPLRSQTEDLEIVGVVRDYGPFDWIFIDAGHDYEEVKSDWELYGPLTSEDAVVVFHDITSDHPGVVQLWREIRNEGYLTQELVSTTQYPYGRDGLGIGIVYMVSR